MNDDKIRDVMSEGLQQGIRDAVAYAFAKFWEHDNATPSDDPQRGSDNSQQALGNTLQTIFVKARIAVEALKVG